MAKELNVKCPQTFDFSVWQKPPAPYSQAPFWFWNDELEEGELIRQMSSFQAKGVDAFVIHPRIGLPKTIGWMSDRLLHFMKIVVEEAKRRGMWIILYDEGMYPSGSAGGLIVESNPALHVRGLICEDEGEKSKFQDAKWDRHLLATVERSNGRRVSIYNQKVDAVVRGLHYINEKSLHVGEEEYPVADLLNPASTQSFIEHVYEKFYQELGAYFGNTIKAIFTDEPNPLGRLKTPHAMPGTTGILEYVSHHAGYSFEKHLPALWFDDEPDAIQHRENYKEAIAARMDESYYQPLAKWCEKHDVALTGHPADPDEIGHMRYFQWPGQDIVWRHIEPDKPSALEGAPSTMAKAAASVAAHLGRKRNLNEFAGAYGAELTFEELQWLASWLLIRGCNLLVPHAFYYSMRGIRKDERPPDVGPNNIWWNQYREWADLTRRLCWLNAEFKPVCSIAILGKATSLPWQSAKACFENQIDFHYIEPKDLESARVADGSLIIGDFKYSLVIVEESFEAKLPDGIVVLDWKREGAGGLFRRASSCISLDRAAADLRMRRLRKGNSEVYLLFNEGRDTLRRRISFSEGRKMTRLNPKTGEVSDYTNGGFVEFSPHSWVVFLAS